MINNRLSHIREIHVFSSQMTGVLLKTVKVHAAAKLNINLSFQTIFRAMSGDLTGDYFNI